MFVGKVVAGDASVARFQVLAVRQGTPPGPMVDVDNGDTDDRRFVADGKTYQEALANAEVVMEQWVQTAREMGRPIREPKGRLLYTPEPCAL